MATSAGLFLTPRISAANGWKFCARLYRNCRASPSCLIQATPAALAKPSNRQLRPCQFKQTLSRYEPRPILRLRCNGEPTECRCSRHVVVAIDRRELEPLAKLAIQHRLPAVTLFPDFARAGGLLAYGVNLLDMYRQAGTIAAKVMKGRKPAELPIERPAKLEFAVKSPQPQKS